jgi:hypothetical protein
MQTSAPAPALPEIDPEMAALEAGSKGKAKTLAESILAALSGRRTKGQPSLGPGSLPKTVMSADRATKRAVQRREARDPAKSPHARLGRAKPVKSKAQQESEFRAAIRAQLSRIPLTMILKDCPDVKYIVGVPGIRNVWQLSRASTATVHAIPGLGPKRRQAVRRYLAEQRVPVSWEA